MSRTEIINEILFRMDLGTHYRFYDIWFKALNTDNVHDWHKRKKLATPILDLMKKRRFIEQVRIENESGRLDYIIQLAPKGVKIKADGGLQNIIEPSTIDKMLSAFGHMSNIGGTIAFITVAIGGIIWLGNKWLQEPEVKQKKSPTNNQSSMDSISHTKDSLVHSQDSIKIPKNHP